MAISDWAGSVAVGVRLWWRVIVIGCCRRPSLISTNTIEPDIQANNHITMSMKLTQKRFLKGIREFELIDDAIHVRIKTPFNKEKLTVSLSMLNPNPVVNQASLEFHGRDTNEPLLSLFLNQPNPEEFDAFVEALKRRVLEAYSVAAGIKAASHSGEFNGNPHHEPPEFEESHDIRLRVKVQAVDAGRIEHAIRMLETYLVADDIKPLLSALEALKAEPRNESCLLQVTTAFNDLKGMQGAVLTYAPYLSILFSDNPFE
ncbi:MAG TPA: hypothetical protein VK971_06205 [Thiohalobacter sp.]|nr:hypothetical protein [Thiohalobacter sp.]